MRICIISREYPPDTGWGGIGAYSYLHANTLAQLGHDVEVVALAKEDVTATPAVQNGAHRGADYYIALHRVPWGKALSRLDKINHCLPSSHYTIKCATALWKTFHALHAQRPFDVVEAPEHLGEAIFPALTRVCPLVVRLHTPHFKIVDDGLNNLARNFDTNLLGTLERLAILEANLVTSPSRDLASYVCAKTGLDLKTVCMVANPVDADKFSPEGKRALASNGKLIVLFAGRLEERKGVYQLMDAIPQVVKQVENVRFVLIGKDTDTGPGGSSAKKILEERLAASKCSQYVEFINHVNLEDMPACYRSADLCVVPSLYDNAPYTVLEAMSCGKPIVATSAGGIPEYLVHNETGLLVPPGDVAALAKSLTELLLDKQRRERFGVAARERTLSVYDKREVAAKTVDAYKLAIARYKAREVENAALYRKHPEELLDDCYELLMSYQQDLYNLLYVHSLTFRIKHWKDLAAKQPQLFKEKLVLVFGTIVSKLTRRPSTLERKLQNLRQKISADEEALWSEERRELIGIGK
jgi:glycosyltransferase involved in cell wall biosynthesis